MLFIRKPVFIGVSAFCFLLLLTQLLSYERYLLLKQAEIRDLNNEANSAKERVQTVLSYNLSTAQTLGFIVEKYGVPQNFDSVGAALLRSNKFVDIVQLVEGGVITHIFPLKGNEVVIGYDILKDSVRNSGAIAAIKAKEFFWAGPLELKQGGVGIIGRQPLFKNNQFKGFSAVVIQLPTFLHAVGIDSASGRDFYYQFSRVNATDGKEEFFLGNKQLSKNAFVVPVKIPNSEWRLYVARKRGNALFVAITLSTIGFILSAIGGLFAWYFVRQPEELNKRVEEKTKQLSEAYKTNEAALNRITDAVLSLDRDSTITFINRTAQLRLSRGKEVIPESEILGKKVWDVYSGVTQTPFYEKYHQALQTQKELEEEGFFEPTNNWVLMKMYPAVDGVTIYSVDISESKKAQQEILLEKNFSKSIINSLPGAFYLYDKNGKFIRWNRNFEIISGYTSEEISNMHPLDFFDVDEKGLLQKKIEEVFSVGMAEVEAPLMAKDKSKTPYFFNGHVANLNGEDYLIGMGIDITERKNAENALLKMTSELRERVKELNCLYRISEISNSNAFTIEDILRQCIIVIPSAYQYPEITCTRIAFEDKVFCSEKFRETKWKQETEIFIDKEGIGKIEVFYMEEKQDEQEGPFMKEERLLIDAIAKVISTSLERKKAETEIKQSQYELRQLSAHLQTVREEERTGIAREIHDELGQQLTGLKMDASWLSKKLSPEEKQAHEKLGSMISLMDDTVKTIRRISSELRPGILDDLGLLAALEWQSSEFEKRSGISCKFVSLLHEVHFERNLATGIFRVYQEALTNVVRHSKATSVESTLTQTVDKIILTVKDNGEGFDIEAVKSKKTLGLLGMKERALMFGCELKLDSKPGSGTTVILEIPSPY